MKGKVIVAILICLALVGGASAYSYKRPVHNATCDYVVPLNGTNNGWSDIDGDGTDEVYYSNYLTKGKSILYNSDTDWAMNITGYALSKI